MFLLLFNFRLRYLLLDVAVTGANYDDWKESGFTVTELEVFDTMHGNVDDYSDLLQMKLRKCKTLQSKLNLVKQYLKQHNYT